MRKKCPTTFQIYKDDIGEHRWRALRVGRIVAESGEGYKTVKGLKKSLAKFIESIALDNIDITHDR